MLHLTYIDLQKGQMNKKDQNYPIPLPSCLIEFKPITWSNTGGGQLGSLIVSFYQYYDLVSDTFNGSETEQESLSILDYQDDLYNALEGFATDTLNPLQRVFDAKPEYRDRYIVLQTDFQSTLIQENVPNRKGKLPNSLNITIKKDVEE